MDELNAQAPFKVTGVINPGVLATVNALEDKNSTIMILGTRATINSAKYKTLLEELGYKNTFSIAPSLFVPIVEEGLFDGDVLNSAIKYYFKDVKEPDAIILGCTHFPLISNAIKDHFPNAKLIHSGDAVVEYLKKEYNLKNNFKQTNIKFFATENPDGLKNTAKKWLEI
jgi:glutamate racemase